MNRRDLLAAAACVAISPRHALAAENVLNGWLARWLAAFNDPDLRQYRDFVLRHAPTVAPYVDDDLGVREISGGFELLRSQVTGPGEITAWVKDRDWDRYSRVMLAAKAKARLDDIAFAGAPSPDSFAIPRLGEQEVLAALDEKLGALANDGRVSGAVLVARNGGVLFSKAYGAAGPGEDAGPMPATRFCVGSMGKMFTATAVMQLVEKGRLKLTDTVGAHLPGYANKAVAERVTIEQLLSHTGGTGDIFGPDYDGHAVKTPAELVTLYGARDPAFQPGSRWGYSNFGFVLLGRILEQVDGRPYDAVVQARVLRPAGMTSTSSSALSTGPSALPFSGARRTGLKALAAYVGGPAGGGYSTVEDLHAFATALRDGRVLSPATLALMTAPRVEAGSARWGLGFSLRRRNGAVCYGHGGAAPGVNGDFAVYPGTGYETVVLCNRGHPMAVNIAEFIGSRLPTA